MILYVDSDAAYLVLPKARSRIAGFFRLRNKHNDIHKQKNGAILVECKALRWVVTSAAEAETHGVYHNTIIAINICTILNAMEHPQPSTPIQTDNSTTEGFVNKTMTLKKFKIIGYALKFSSRQRNPKVKKLYWGKGKNNNANYFTKVVFPIIYHQHIRNRYVKDRLRSLDETLNHISETYTSLVTERVC